MTASGVIPAAAVSTTVPANCSSSSQRNKTPSCDGSSPAASVAAGVASDRGSPAYLRSANLGEKYK